MTGPTYEPLTEEDVKKLRSGLEVPGAFSHQMLAIALLQAFDTIDAERAAKNAAYAERQKVMVALARAAQALGHHVGVWNDMNQDPDWRTVLHIALPTGQVTWHFHSDDSALLEEFPRDDESEWDGHDTPEKYRRVLAWKPEAPP